MDQGAAERLTEDLRSAMRAGDTTRRDVIRYLRAAIKNREIDMRRELDEDEIVEVIQTQIKQRRDSIDAYRSGGRDDLADTEAVELVILEEYLPADQKPLSEDELRRIVASKAEELGLAGPADMRVLMPALIDETQGRADNRLLSQLASAELQRRASS